MSKRNGQIPCEYSTSDSSDKISYRLNYLSAEISNVDDAYAGAPSWKERHFCPKKKTSNARVKVIPALLVPRQARMVLSGAQAMAVKVVRFVTDTSLGSCTWVEVMDQREALANPK